MTYNDLYERNWPIIDKETQNKISQLKIGIAGVGSTGGAFADGSIRLGVVNFKLADNGVYETNNLNRQMVYKSDMNMNKAFVYKKRLEEIYPGVSIKIYEDGITPENINDFLDGVDIVFDAVDVTTDSGIKMKLLLHEKACEKKIAVPSALDIGYTQWLRTFDYRHVDKPLNGFLEKARMAQSPILAIVNTLCPVEDFTNEILDEFFRLSDDPDGNVCQLATACFLLSAMVTPYLTRFVNDLEIPEILKIDIRDPFLTGPERKIIDKKRTDNLKKLKNVLSQSN